MTDILNKETIIRQFPLFTGLSSQEYALLEPRCNLKEYPKGTIIYKENDPPDAFYGVILGRITISTQGKEQYSRVVEYLHRGKYFGIISLLTKDPHSVTARALNDCQLLVIQKEDFDFLLTQIPSLGVDLSQTLSRRLKDKDVHRKTIFETEVISVFSSYARAGKTIYAFNLAFSLAKETHKSVILLEIRPKDTPHSLAQKVVTCNSNICKEVLDLSVAFTDFGPKAVSNFIIKDKDDISLLCLSFDPENEDCVKRLIALLSLLVNDYHYILMDLSSVLEQSTFKMLYQSDVIHLLTSPEPVGLKKTLHLVERLREELNFPYDKIKIIFTEYDLAKIDNYQLKEFLGGHPVFATLPKMEFSASDRMIFDSAQSEYARAVRRISRQAGDVMVGLALGIGVAYGFCHIGVLKVIEEENIPIDVISGASMGAFIACLWATGKTSIEILEIAREFRQSNSIWSLVDLTLPMRGFIKGNKLQSFFKKHLGAKTFYDVKLPLKIIASDVKRKEPRVLEHGLLVDALMASCAMPGVFLPFHFKGEMLFDGGVSSPVPTEILFSMGLKKIIAVNVTPSREDVLRQYEKIKADFSLKDKIRKRGFNFRQYLHDRLQTNILGIIFSSVELLQSEVAKKEEQLADIVLHPNTEDMHWLEFHRAEEFMHRGEIETRNNLGKIWQVINE